jgi:hypothetical protein
MGAANRRNSFAAAQNVAYIPDGHAEGVADAPDARNRGRDPGFRPEPGAEQAGGTTSAAGGTGQCVSAGTSTIGDPGIPARITVDRFLR